MSAKPIPYDVSGYSQFMSLASTRSGEHTITISSTQTLPEEWTPVVYDTQTGETADMLDQKSLVIDLGMKKTQADKDTVDLNPGHIANRGLRKAESPRLVFGLSRTLITSLDELYLPKEFSLAQNYPNPFNPSTTIHYEVPTASEVRIEVYDLLGKRVSVLVNEQKTVGKYTIQFNASGLSSGMYFYRMIAGGKVFVKKMMLIK